MRTQKFFESKLFFDRKFFRTENFFGSKLFSDQKSFLTNKFLEPEYSPNFFLDNIFFAKILFLHDLFYSTLVFFGPLVVLLLPRRCSKYDDYSQELALLSLHNVCSAALYWTVQPSCCHSYEATVVRQFLP